MNLTSPAHFIARIVTIMAFLAVPLICKGAAQPGKSGDYAVKEIGWKTSIPAGWKAMTAEEKAKLSDTGQKALEKATGETIDVSGLRELLNLKKDQFNSFFSTIEPFNEAKDGKYADAQKKVVEAMVNAYKGAGVKLGRVAEGTEIVDGLEFVTIEIEIVHPKTDAVILTQKMFSRLINGFDFGMTVSSNNEKDRSALLGIVRSSKFSLRE